MFSGGFEDQCLFFLHQKAGANIHHFQSATGRRAFLLGEAKEIVERKNVCVRWQKGKGEQLGMAS